MQGDVIVDINGTAITSADDLQKVSAERQAGPERHDHLLRGRQQADDDGDAREPGTGAATAAGSGSTTNPFGGGGFPGFGNSGSTGGTP